MCDCANKLCKFVKDNQKIIIPAACVAAGFGLVAFLVMKGGMKINIIEVKNSDHVTIRHGTDAHGGDKIDYCDCGDDCECA